MLSFCSCINHALFRAWFSYVHFQEGGETLAYDGTLKFDTRVDSSGFKAGIEKIGSIAKTGLKTAVTAIGAVSAAFSAGIVSGVKYNSQMEQYITSFGTMLGSAEKATALVNDLKEMGAKTPFETADLAKGSQTLLAFGITAKDLLPTMQMLGDVSQGNKERFDSLTLAFAQVSSAGKLSGQDLLQFVNAGFNPLNEIAKVTGESMEDLRERMSDGGVSADEVAQAFKRATSEGGQFYQAMEAQSQTFNGQLSTLKDNVSSFVGEVTQGVSNTLKDEVLPMVNGWLTELQTAFQNGGAKGLASAIGSILAEACAEVAQAAPGVIEMAVQVIQSFVSGIRKNSSKLLDAARQIVSALVDGLVKLLPIQVQKPVKDTINILKKSFQDGGLKSAINTIKTLVQNLGTILTRTAKTILPPLANAVDFLAGNLKTILPLLTGAVTAWKAWQIAQNVKGWMEGATTAIAAAAAATTAETAATGASTAALSLKEVAVGVLTGQIGLATAAQTLWNAVMNANPIGLVITAVAALGAAIGALTLIMGDIRTEEEILYDKQLALGESFGEAAQAAVDFQDGIKTAESHLSSFDDTLFASSEKQQELQQNMEEVQNGITTICKTAADERRGYTEEEIKQLDEYFQKLAELNQEQYDIQAAKMEAVREQAVEIAETNQGSLEEYQALSQEWIATAQEQYDAQIQLANDQAINEIALLKQKYGDKATMDNEEYAKEYETIQARKEKNIQSAQDEVAAVTTAFAEGYIERAENLQGWLLAQSELHKQEEEEIKRNKDKEKELAEDAAEAIKKIEEDQTLTEQGKRAERDRILQEYNDAMEEESTRHADEMKRINSAMSTAMNDEQEIQLGVWLSLVSDAELYGGKLTKKSEKMAEGFIASFDRLPEDTKTSAKDAMKGMLEGLEEEEPSLYSKAASVAGGILGQLNKIFDIHSPSKATRKIFKRVMEGGEKGLEDETPSLLKQTTGVAESVTKGFQKVKFNASALVQKMKNAIASQSRLLVSPAVSTAAWKSVQPTYAYAGDTSAEPPATKYQIDIPLYLNGQEIAKATAEYTDAELQEINRRKERGG